MRLYENLARHLGRFGTILGASIGASLCLFFPGHLLTTPSSGPSDPQSSQLGISIFFSIRPIFILYKRFLIRSAGTLILRYKVI